MIKLIVSDMDGTLLDDRHQLPPDFGEVFAALRDRGVPLVVASGRSLTGLRPYLAQMPGMPACICDNGAFLVEGAEITSIREIPGQKLRLLLDACAGIPDIQLVLCGISGTYYREGTPRFMNSIQTMYDNDRKVDDFYKLDDIFFKVGISDPHGPQNNSYPVLAAALGELLSIRISGDTWIDLTDRDVNKGAAVKALQQRLGVTPAETMTFGDYYNDIELLGCAYYSFVMESAVPDMRRFGNYLAAGNNEHGVTRAIREYVLNQPC